MNIIISNDRRSDRVRRFFSVLSAGRACILAISTAESKGLAIKSSAPSPMAMTIFMLSEVKEMKMIGTLETLRISPRQWYPLSTGRPMSSGTICGRHSAKSVITSRKIPTTRHSRAHILCFFFYRSEMPWSTSTINYFRGGGTVIFPRLPVRAVFLCGYISSPGWAAPSRPTGTRRSGGSPAHGRD